MSLKSRLKLIHGVMNCSGCSCCDAGTVYVFPHEMDELKSKGVELAEAFGFYFIPQREKGCIYYNAEKIRCEIYDHRPICCRLFPLDISLSSHESRLYWVCYKGCKQVSKLIKEVKTRRAVFNILDEIERSLTEEDIVNWHNMNIVTRRLERGENVLTKYQILRPLRCDIHKILRRHLPQYQYAYQHECEMSTVESCNHTFV